MALLPFVHAERLRSAVKPLYAKLEPEEVRGRDGPGAGLAVPLSVTSSTLKSRVILAIPFFRMATLVESQPRKGGRGNEK